jgi:hypothetical protein
VPVPKVKQAAQARVPRMGWRWRRGGASGKRLRQHEDTEDDDATEEDDPQ